MRAAIAPGPFSPPGLAVLINDTIAACGIDGAGRPITTDSIWPLACLTKLALADMAVQTFDLDRPITAWLPEVGWPFTIRQLLTHTSGLPLDLPNDEYGTLDRDDVRDRMLRIQPVHASGPVAYSNIGYGWLAVALERVTAESLTEIFWRYGLAWGDEVAREPVVITDVRSPFTGTPAEPFNSAYWRSLRLPWCGAFGTLATVRQLLDRVHPLVRASRASGPGGFPPGAFFGFSQNAGAQWDDAAWGCGVEFRGTKVPHWLGRVSPESYGHVGSSGILAWTDGGTTFVLAGSRTTDGGWLMRQGPRVSASAFAQVST